HAASQSKPEDDQYHETGSSETVSLNVPLSAPLSLFPSITFNSALEGTCQSWCPCASSFAAYFSPSLNVKVSFSPPQKVVERASAGVVYMAAPVSGETPAKIVPSGIWSPTSGSPCGAGCSGRVSANSWRLRNPNMMLSPVEPVRTLPGLL